MGLMGSLFFGIGKGSGSLFGGILMWGCLIAYITIIITKSCLPFYRIKISYYPVSQRPWWKTSCFLQWQIVTNLTCQVVHRHKMDVQAVGSACSRMCRLLHGFSGEVSSQIGIYCSWRRILFRKCSRCLSSFLEGGDRGRRRAGSRSSRRSWRRRRGGGGRRSTRWMRTTTGRRPWSMRTIMNRPAWVRGVSMGEPGFSWGTRRGNGLKESFCNNNEKVEEEEVTVKPNVMRQKWPPYLRGEAKEKTAKWQMSKSDKYSKLYETVFTQPVKSPNYCE